MGGGRRRRRTKTKLIEGCAQGYTSRSQRWWWIWPKYIVFIYKITKWCVLKVFFKKNGKGGQGATHPEVLEEKGQITYRCKVRWISATGVGPREPSHTQGTKQGYIFPGHSHLIQMQNTREAKRASLQTLGTEKVHQPSKRPTLMILKMNLIKKKDNRCKK